MLEGLSLESSVLGRSVSFAVYLPPDYDCSSRRYPVVYLLHGYTDDESGWIQFGEANRLADEGINQGLLPPLIIVMPDGGVTFYIDNHSGEVRYETMFVTELIPHIDSTYRTRAAKEFRAVAGLSMGGYGSLVLALHNPELFASCAALSGAVRSDSDVVSMPDERWDRVYGPPFGAGLRGEQRLTDHMKANSPLHLVRSMPEEELKKVRWYIDSGDDDGLTSGNALLYLELRKRGIPHEFRVRDGAHTWSYWRSGLPEALAFLGSGFHR